MTSLKVKAGILEMNFEPRDPDRRAAWELYVELLTRVATQPLPDQDGDEKTALDSVHDLFALTREILRKNYGADQFAKIAVVVLNQVVRPFTAKWHPLSIAGAFEKPKGRKEFRADLRELQEKLTCYTQMLANMAAVENLAHLERTD